MRILVDENSPGLLVIELDRRGHDVRWVARDMKGAGDDEIAGVARTEGRVLVTYDKGFSRRAMDGELSAGVIILRLDRLRVETVAQRVLAVLDRGEDWSNLVAVTTPARVRRRRMPR